MKNSKESININAKEAKRKTLTAIKGIKNNDIESVYSNIKKACEKGYNKLNLDCRQLSPFAEIPLIVSKLEKDGFAVSETNHGNNYIVLEISW